MKVLLPILIIMFFVIGCSVSQQEPVRVEIPEDTPVSDSGGFSRFYGEDSGKSSVSDTVIEGSISSWLKNRNFRFAIAGNGYIITYDYIDRQGNHYKGSYDIQKTFRITIRDTKIEGDENGYITIRVPNLGTSVYTVGSGGLQLVR